jgi:hypothetical protein
VCTFLKQYVTPAPETVAELAESEPSRPGELLPQTIAYVWIDYSCVPTRSDLAVRHEAAMAAAGASTSSVLTSSTATETAKPGSMRRTYSGVSAPAAATTDGGTATVGAAVGSGATDDLEQLAAPIDHETLVSNSLTVLLRSTHFLAVPGSKAMPALETDAAATSTAATSTTAAAAATAATAAAANGGSKSRRTSSGGKEAENCLQNGLPPAPRRQSSANRYAYCAAVLFCVYITPVHIACVLLVPSTESGSAAAGVHTSCHTWH